MSYKLIYLVVDGSPSMAKNAEWLYRILDEITSIFSAVPSYFVLITAECRTPTSPYTHRLIYEGENSSEVIQALRQFEFVEGELAAVGLSDSLSYVQHRFRNDDSGLGKLGVHVLLCMASEIKDCVKFGILLKPINANWGLIEFSPFVRPSTSSVFLQHFPQGHCSYDPHLLSIPSSFRSYTAHFWHQDDDMMLLCRARNPIQEEILSKFGLLRRLPFHQQVTSLLAELDKPCIEGEQKDLLMRAAILNVRGFNAFAGRKPFMPHWSGKVNFPSGSSIKMQLWVPLLEEEIDFKRWPCELELSSLLQCDNTLTSEAMSRARELRVRIPVGSATCFAPLSSTLSKAIGMAKIDAVSVLLLTLHGSIFKAAFLNKALT